MIRECSRGFDINKLDISELINTVLLLDIQNREYCIRQQKGQSISGGSFWDWAAEMVFYQLIRIILGLFGYNL